MRWFELKVPPVLLVPITAACMWLTSYLLPDTHGLTTGRIAFLVGGTAVGAFFALVGLLAFRHADTTVLPHCPEQVSTLVTTGIYRYTRNPMYLSFIVFLCGFSGFLGTAWSLTWVVVLVVYLTQFQIKPEERALARLFPDDFSAYCQRVRRWL